MNRNTDANDNKPAFQFEIAGLFIKTHSEYEMQLPHP